MMDFRVRAIACAGALALVATACGGGGTGAAPPVPGANANTTPQAFSQLSSAPMAVGDVRPFAPSEPGYSGTYAVTSSAPGVVAVSPASGAGPFQATAVSPGAATVTVQDQAGRSSSVPLSVGSIGFGAMSGAPLTVGSQRQFTPSEPSYGGAWTVSSSNPAVISATPGSGAGPFTLAALSPGQSTITVADSTGRQASTTLTVSGSGGSVAVATPSPTPVPTPTPTATPAPIAITPSSLTLDLGQVAYVSAADNAGSAMSTPAVADPSIATIVATAPGTYEVSGNAAGSTSITFTDAAGNTAVLPVNVPASPPPVIALNPTGVTAGRASIGVGVVTLAPTEAGYSGKLHGHQQQPERRVRHVGRKPVHRLHHGPRVDDRHRAGRQRQLLEHRVHRSVEDAGVPPSAVVPPAVPDFR